MAVARPVATALNGRLAWEPPYAVGAALGKAKRQKKKKKKKKKKNKPPAPKKKERRDKKKKNTKKKKKKMRKQNKLKKMMSPNMWKSDDNQNLHKLQQKWT